MIAALYVETNGCYFGLPDVDPWDIHRDARKYDGPHPVVAHPPCARWCKLAGFVDHVYPGRFKKGDDGGCFAHALASVRRWGGILEHPEGSAAWDHFGLITPPKGGGWVVADWEGGWTCSVEQGAYGHKARKATWLYACHVDLPSLRWGKAPGDYAWTSYLEYNTDEGRRRATRTGIVQRLSKKQRAATPHAFRDLLVRIARTANTQQQAAA